FNVSSASGGNTRSAAARFSRRCATDEVPGIKRIFGERCSSHASATCIGVAPSESATACSPEDCSGVKPPSGKNGTQAIPCCASESTSASSPRFTTLYIFCTHTTETIFCASATCEAVTLLSPIWRTSPCCCSSARVLSGAAIEPSGGHTPQPPVNPVQHTPLQGTQVVMPRLRQLLSGKRRQPGGILAASGSDLGHNRKVVPVRMKRLADTLVGHMRSVKIAGINVIHTRRHRFTQHRQRRIFVFCRTKNARPAKL